MAHTKITAAAAQFAPVYLDAEGSLSKAQAIAQNAKKDGVQWLVFPETWLQGYPYFAAGLRSPEFRALYARLHASATTPESGHIAKLQTIAAETGVALTMGLHERVGHTLYASLVHIDSQGELLGVHRKLMPTVAERLVWGMGDGSDLHAMPSSLGRMGGLICWEHHMALARYALCSQGVELHASVFPGLPWIDAIADAVTRQTAFENGCAVVVAREVMSLDHLPADIRALVDSDAQYWTAHGGSALIQPGGTYAVAPVTGPDEKLVVGELDLSLIPRAKLLFDGTGHYSRPDVFRMHWDDRPKSPVEIGPHL